MKFYLIVAKGKKQGMPIPITVDLFLIGTDKTCQLRSKVPGVAAQHCALITRAGKVFLRDYDHEEPTLVNGDLAPPGRGMAAPCGRPANHRSAGIHHPVPGEAAIAKRPGGMGTEVPGRGQ